MSGKCQDPMYTVKIIGCYCDIVVNYVTPLHPYVIFLSPSHVNVGVMKVHEIYIFWELSIVISHYFSVCIIVTYDYTDMNICFHGKQVHYYLLQWEKFVTILLL